MVGAQGQLPERTVLVGGMPYFGRKLAALLDSAAHGGRRWRASYLETRGWRPGPALAALKSVRNADLVCMVGGQIERGSRPHLLRLATRAAMVMLWAGSDVLYATAARQRGRVAGTLLRNVTHWAGAPWLGEELAGIGVEAHYLPHSWVDSPAALLPFQSEFTVLTYLQRGRERFYGGPAVVALARALPEARVLVVGTDGPPRNAPPNLECLGWVEEMSPLWARAQVLVRLPEHDGLSFMVQEALAHGRYAVWNRPYPTVQEARTADDVISHVRALMERHAAGDLPLNEAGAAHVRARHRPEVIRAELLDGFMRVLDGR